MKRTKIKIRTKKGSNVYVNKIDKKKRTKKKEVKEKTLIVRVEPKNHGRINTNCNRYSISANLEIFKH